ncbi:cation-transporting P-type ATPase [Pedococcus sp. KACC 23699]|uniref:Cation-transporting P-type ATPase n=1 Tax=Pedococcus sp. KACC 23699 TaxID=3149228 RepID=A0AAU7JT86_9MICO
MTTPGSSYDEADVRVVACAPKVATPDQDQGLTGAEARRLLGVNGPNSLPTAPPTRVVVRVLRALKDPLVLVLLGALALTLATTDLTDAAVIALVVVVNTTLAVRQELSADRAVQALSSLVSPSAQVTRDGREQSVPVRDLVPGDLVHLRQGDLVPADATLLRGPGLTVDESTLTGESLPVTKAPWPGEPAPARSDLAGRAARLHAGTAVTTGRGTAVVTATGPASATGRIASMLVEHEQRQTPLQHRMARLSGYLAAAAVLLCAVVFALGLLRGEPLEEMLLTAVSLMVAAVPESLPLVVTLSMAMAARRMASRHAVVRSLAAVETLGSVTLIATDKTGTLTEGKMAVSSTWCPDGSTDRDLVVAITLCNDAREVTVDGAVPPDPTETALLDAAVAAGVDPGLVRAEHPRLSERPFDSRTKRMTTWHSAVIGSGAGTGASTGAGAGTGLHVGEPGTEPQAAPSSVLVVSKGAPEVMLRADVLTDGPAVLEAARHEVDVLAATGARVLAVAQGESTGSVGVVPRLGLLGLVALRDRPRPAAARAVSRCRDAGVEVALITGDHPATAQAVASAVNISTDEPPLALHDGSGSGVDLDREGVDHDAARLHHVIARATPGDKLELISAWQRRGHVVAMLGDGVNDAPALHRADIGVALGRRGTEVAREAADVVLTDDNLATVVAAVEEGRRVYANIRRFLLYGISGGAAEILLMLGGPVVGIALPLLPAQILWVNLVTHSFAGAALGAEPLEDGTMAAGPRPPSQGALDRLWWRLLVLSTAVATMSLLGSVVAGGGAGPSTALVSLGTGQLAVALAVRSRTSVERGRSRFVLPATLAAALALLVAAVTVPPLAALLGTAPLPPASWAWAAGAGCLAYLVGRLVRPASF